MSQGNAQFTWNNDLALHKKVINTDYTIRTGRPDSNDNGLMDNPVVVTDPADDITITLPDGKDIGQTLLVVMSSNTSSKNATITVTHHSGADGGTEPLDAADEYMYFMWTGTEWVTISYSTAGDIA